MPDYEAAGDLAAEVTARIAVRGAAGYRGVPMLWISP
jgi:hypothetical protein